MSSLSFINKHKAVFDPEKQYAVNSIVYVRGSKEGYEHTKQFYDTTLQSTQIKNRIKRSTQQMMQRYIDLRNEALSLRMGMEGKFSEKEIIAAQEKWTQAIIQGLQTRQSGNLSQSTASTMKKVQEALSSLKKNEDKQVIEELHSLVLELEEKFNALSDVDKRDLAGLIYDSKTIEGKIINIKNGEIVFSRLRNTLNKLSKYGQIKIGSAIRATNAEFGALGEVMDTFALYQISKYLQNTLGQNFTNMKVKQVGSQQVKDEYGSIGTGTTDTLFTYEGAYNGENVIFDFGISLKTTGTILDENGKWIQKNNPAEIKIKTISAQYKIWNQISSALGIGKYSTKLENSVLNTLVWTNANSNSYKIITKSLLSSFFEKYLAGGSRLVNDFGVDIVDVIMINGIPIPVTVIIATIIDQLDNDEFLSKNKSLAFIQIPTISNKREGSSKNSVIDAMKRSERVRNIIKKTLSAKVYLNGNILYNIAKQYIR